MTVALASRGATVGFEALAAARCASFLVIAHRLYLLVVVRPPFELKANYLATTRFPLRPVKLWGLRRLVTFTATRYLFEVAWAVSHLVTSVTTYVLVPAACDAFDGDVRDLPLLQADQLVLHNVNCILMHVDTLLSGQYLAYDHAGAALLYACYASPRGRAALRRPASPPSTTRRGPSPSSCTWASRASSCCFSTSASS
ncbi:hypothetical protein JL722_14854 [Aureococcus anophagefferens]|nr:hypothetical protein JL722_14854 [Aureococcus anophagefferens]